MKKLLCTLLALSMLLGLAACGGPAPAESPVSYTHLTLPTILLV